MPRTSSPSSVHVVSNDSCHNPSRQAYSIPSYSIVANIEQVAEVFTGIKGVLVSLKDTLRSFQEVLDGKHDDLPESAFYMVSFTVFLQFSTS